MFPEIIGGQQKNRFRSLYEVPRNFERIKDGALFIEHPGFARMYPGQWRESYEKKYMIYSRNLLKKIHLSGERTLCIIAPVGYIDKTIAFLGGIRNSMVIIPTKEDYATEVDGELLGHWAYVDTVWKDISKQLTWAETCGEFADPGHCVPALESTLLQAGVKKIIHRR